MAETLRELVVALSLDSSNFSRNMRTINAQIKEAESTFRLAGAVCKLSRGLLSFVLGITPVFLRAVRAKVLCLLKPLCDQQKKNQSDGNRHVWHARHALFRAFSLQNILLLFFMIAEKDAFPLLDESF